MRNTNLFCALSFTLLSIASHAADCGKVDNKSFRFDFDGYLKGFAVEINDGKNKLFVTDTNSKELHEDVLDRFLERSFEDRFEMGLFVCFDKYTSSKRTLNSGEVRVYPKTKQHRLWENGKLVAQFPLVENLDALADDIGEYFDVSELTQYGYEYKVVQIEKKNFRINVKARELFRQRSEYLKPQGTAHDFEVFAIYLKGSKELRGYIVSIHDSIDHPLWDGSGVTIYLDANADVTTRVEWAG